MESLIASLVAAFEQGRIDRRQLIRTLALAATGTAVLTSPDDASAAPPTFAAPAFRTIGLSHISYSVADYARSRDFYADLMGWRVRRDDAKQQAAVLAVDDVGLMIIRNANRVPRTGPTGVIDHIAFRIADFDSEAVRAELAHPGLDPKRDQGGPPGFDSFHVLGTRRLGPPDHQLGLARLARRLPGPRPEQQHAAQGIRTGELGRQLGR